MDDAHVSEQILTSSTEARCLARLASSLRWTFLSCRDSTSPCLLCRVSWSWRKIQEKYVSVFRLLWTRNIGVLSLSKCFTICFVLCKRWMNYSWRTEWDDPLPLMNTFIINVQSNYHYNHYLPDGWLVWSCVTASLGAWPCPSRKLHPRHCGGLASGRGGQPQGCPEEGSLVEVWEGGWCSPGKGPAPPETDCSPMSQETLRMSYIGWISILYTFFYALLQQLLPPLKGCFGLWFFLLPAMKSSPYSPKYWSSPSDSFTCRWEETMLLIWVQYET